MPLEHSKLGVIFNLDSQTWTVTIERGDPASCSTKEEAAEERKYLKRETRERDRPRGYSRRLPRTIQPLSPILTHFSPLPCLSRGRAKRFPAAIQRDSSRDTWVHPSSHATNDPRVDAPCLHFNTSSSYEKRNKCTRARREARLLVGDGGWNKKE